MMAEPAFADASPPNEEDVATDRVVKGLIWLLIATILVIAVAALITALKVVLSAVAAATTLLALAALGVASVFAVRVHRLERRIEVLEARAAGGSALRPGRP